MQEKGVEIIVYGAQQLCPSCVNLPSSRETYEWLDAALKRKFQGQAFRMEYVDIHQPPDDEQKREFAMKVIEEDMFYPVVVLEGKVVGEGNPRLKTIASEMERLGYRPV